MNGSRIIWTIASACFGIVGLLSCNQPAETTPQRRDIVDAVFASGNMETKNEYKVIANADGYLEDAYVTEGDSVIRGQRLFRLEGTVQQAQAQNAGENYRFAVTNADPQSPPLDQLTLQITQAAEKFHVDSTNFRRYERLLPTKAVAEVDYDNARLTMEASSNSLQVLRKNLADLQRTLTLNKENAAAQLRIQNQNNNYYLIPAALGGIVLQVYKKVGELVRKGDVLASISAGPYLIKLFIAEEDIDKVQLRQRVLISLNTDTTHVYEAQVTKIYPSFDDSDQSFIAEAYFTSDKPPGTKDGTQLQANIVVAEKKGALVIPTTYLGTGDKVWIKKDNKAVDVKTGIRNLDFTEIESGLTEKETIVMPKH